ncbi:MAG: hypothetical protein K2W95_17060 [Candidatus Obscuribacterales bacterium]|nr:hypothetical protein [Candidatus Obscuribacterales bacterium]
METGLALESRARADGVGKVRVEGPSFNSDPFTLKLNEGENPLRRLVVERNR